MYVESPEGAEIYIDGTYVGVAPVYFAKPSPGSHVITLTHDGYTPKSYTVSIPDDDNDITISFSDLIEELRE